MQNKKMITILLPNSSMAELRSEVDRMVSVCMWKSLKLIDEVKPAMVQALKEALRGGRSIGAKSYTFKGDVIVIVTDRAHLDEPCRKFELNCYIKAHTP